MRRLPPIPSSGLDSAVLILLCISQASAGSSSLASERARPNRTRSLGPWSRSVTAAVLVGQRASGSRSFSTVTDRLPKKPSRRSLRGGIPNRSRSRRHRVLRTQDSASRCPRRPRSLGPVHTGCLQLVETPTTPLETVAHHYHPRRCPPMTRDPPRLSPPTTLKLLPRLLRPPRTPPGGVFPVRSPFGPPTPPHCLLRPSCADLSSLHLIRQNRSRLPRLRLIPSPQRFRPTPLMTMPVRGMTGPSSRGGMTRTPITGAPQPAIQKWTSTKTRTQAPASSSGIHLMLCESRLP